MVWVRGKYSGAAIDSRKVRHGELFFALKGEKTDGHAHLKEVAERGGLGAVVAKGYSGESFGLELTYVQDVKEALQEAGRQELARRSSRVVGVTGSVGKTTTKEFIATLLEAKYRVAKSEGNANSQVSLPLTILNTPMDAEVLVLEMGMTEGGHIRRLVEIAPPEVAVITKIGRSHAEYFSNGIAGIAAAKSEIFSHPKTRVKIMPLSATEWIDREGKLLFDRENAEADFRYVGSAIAERGKCSPSFSLPFSASHFRENVLPAVACARALGLSWEEIWKKVGELKPYRLRFEVMTRQDAVIVNDAYNASPESMKAALENLPAPQKNGKTIAVFGEMVELGQYQESGHREVAELALPKVDLLFCYGKGCLPMMDVFAEAARPAEYHTDLQKLKEILWKLVEPGDVVLIKGSNINGLWKLLE